MLSGSERNVNFVQLQREHAGIPAAPRHELRVRPAFRNLAVEHDEDLVTANDGRKTVGNRQCRAPLAEPA